ncbi:MAG: saccharopine dehydrogenase NADP-binding domain-containing protein [Mycobacterium sp.]
MRAGQRDLDIVIYGATGFVGGLTADYLARTRPHLRAGLAGRSPDRLRAARNRLATPGHDWEITVADLSDQRALAAMTARTAVLISTVGPYSRHGLPLVEACAETGTDYVDLTGEVPFVRRSIERCHQRASRSGARLVHSCGFDSIPSDLNVYALHRRAVAESGGDLLDTTFVLRSYSGGYSGGSVATMIELMRLAKSDPAMRAVLDDVYSLSPDRGHEPDLGAQPDLWVRSGGEIAPELTGLWTGGYLMALYNTRCVRRTNALLGWRYGRNLRYSETMSMGSSPIAPMLAAAMSAGVGLAARYGGHYFDALPTGFVERLTPDRGAGCDTGSGGYYKVETYTTTSRGHRYVASMSQRADPGYSATAVLLGESALLLATERDRLPALAGVLTPAAAMGDALLQRLPEVGVKLSGARLY